MNNDTESRKKSTQDTSVGSGPLLADIDGDLQTQYTKVSRNESDKSGGMKVTDGSSRNENNADRLDKGESRMIYKDNMGDNLKMSVSKNSNSNNLEDSINSCSKKAQNIDEDMDIPTDKNNTISNEGKQEEDVPEDFFDDFLREDFMAGLDIVDEDDEEQDEKQKNNSNYKPLGKKSTEQKGEKLKTLRKSNKEKIDHVRKFRESPPGEVGKFNKKQPKKKIHDDELKRLDAELEEIRKTKPKKTEKLKSGIDADNFDIRRDPEKTRQAIQRDKIKSAKDKEKRLITDIVETGLVPPGMELEVDIEEVRRIERIDKNLPPGDLRKKLGPQKPRSKSPDKHKSFVKKRTPPRRRSHTPSKKRKSRTPKRDSTNVSSVSSALDSDKMGSLTRRSPGHSTSRRSPLRRNPLSHRSPPPKHSPLSRRSPLRRSPQLHRSPIVNRSFLVRRSPLAPRRSPVLWRRTRSKSPTSRRRSRTKSPTLRRKSRSPILHRRSRSRDRSSSYRRRRERSYSPMERDRRRRSRSLKNLLRKEEKRSFLEELAAKLNETHPSQTTLPPVPVSYIMPAAPQPIIAPVPAPVPPPQSVFFSAAPVHQPLPVSTTTQQFDHYDQSFFIGSSAALPQLEQPHLIEQPSPIQQVSQSSGFSGNAMDINSKEDIAKLFDDERIKLSDFLAITAKPQVNNSSPAKLQEKIKVIQRCQEAIKILNERKFTGPLVVQKTGLYQSSKDMTMSPLLRKPVIQLPFTTPGLKKSNEIDFTRACETLLFRIGIEKPLSSHKESEKLKVIPPKEVPQKEIVPPVFPVIQTYSEPTPVKVITKNLGTQTEKELSSCKECLRRKGILYANCGVQAGNPVLTFSVSTQVNEADFYSMIPKTQSLASLTPAQLLGKQSMISDHSRISRNMATQENLSRLNFQVPSPPPPPVFHYVPPQTSQREAPPYPPALFNPASLPSLMQVRHLFGDNLNKPPFTDNRRGGFNSKRF